MQIKREEIYPGIWLNYIHSTRFKTGCFSINLLSPLDYSLAAPNALIPSVLLRGCKACPDIQKISNRLDSLYGACIGSLVRKKGEVQSIGLYADFLEDCFCGNRPIFFQMMNFLRELLFEPCGTCSAFLQEFVSGERLNLINAIDARLNDKRDYAVFRLLTHMCDQEAYGVPRLGTKNSLCTTDEYSLRARWNEILSAAPIELFYLGQQTYDAVRSAVDLLCLLFPSRKVCCKPHTAVVFPDRHPQYIQEKLDVIQGKLSIGLRTEITVSDPRYPAMLLLNAVYGAGMTSKLFFKIREEQSLCYYAHSTIDKYKGIMLINSGIDCNQYDIALEGILRQLDKCKQGEITDEELDTARSYLISGLKSANDSPGRLDDYVVGQAIAGLDGTIEDLALQLKSVSAEQVVEAANTLKLDTVYFLKGVKA